MDIIFPVISDFGYFKIPVVVICLVSLLKGTSSFKKNVITVILSVLLADFTASRVLKPLFARIRPCHIVQGMHLLGGCSDSYSLPSSHAVNITTFAYTMSHFYPKWNKVLCVIAVAVCYSRVYLGMHYPTDCIMGVLVGFVVGHFSVRYIPLLVEYVYRKKKYAR